MLSKIQAGGYNGFLKVKITLFMKSNVVIWIHWLCIYVCSYKKPRMVESAGHSSNSNRL